MKHYCYLLLPEFSNLCLFNSIEPLRAANSFISGEDYKWTLVSMDGGAVTSSSGFEMQVKYGIDNLFQSEPPDALIVLASYNYQRHTTPEVIETLRLLKSRIPVIGGMDSGAYPLAKAGLLNDYKATIHWAELDTFTEQFRKVEVFDNRYVIDRNRITSGGATTALDLMIAIIRRDFGHEIAIAVSDLLIFDTERSDTTPQRAHVPSLIENKTPRLAKAIKLMERYIEEPLSIQQLAKQVGISNRQLERDFKNTLSTTAKAYYSRLRIMRAKQLLTETNLSVTEISLRVGFTSRASFNRSYKRMFNRSPSGERKSN